MHGLPPQPGVLRFAHEVVFVREEQQAGIHPVHLQGGKQLQSLGIGHPVIMLAVNHQHGRAEFGGVIGRIPFLVETAFLPGLSVEFPHREPQLLGCTEHAHLLVNPVVRHQHLEEVVIVMPGDPVDHESAVRSPGSTHPLTVDKIEIANRPAGSGHHILKRRAAPVLAHRIAEVLTVAPAAVEVHHDHHITGCGKQFGVPAIVEIVGKCPLRAAVNQVHQGIFLSRIEFRRFNHQQMHRIAVCAGEPVILHRIHLQLRQPFAVGKGQLG